MSKRESEITFTVEDLRQPYRIERTLQQFLSRIVKLDKSHADVLAKLGASRQASRMGFPTGAIPGSAPPGSPITSAGIVDTIAKTAQVADIASTTFNNSSSGSTFRVSYYLETTTSDGAAGTVTLTISFTDDAGATTIVSAALTLTALGRTSGVAFIRRASGSITYSTSHTGIYATSQYALFICLERLS